MKTETRELVTTLEPLFYSLLRGGEIPLPFLLCIQAGTRQRIHHTDPLIIPASGEVGQEVSGLPGPDNCVPSIPTDIIPHHFRHCIKHFMRQNLHQFRSILPYLVQRVLFLIRIVESPGFFAQV